jgi:gamma-glutamyltranspeptidase/glutathione hydrolase
MATSFPYLLDSIFALSALHLATVEEDSRITWLDAAVRYQSQACSGMAKVLPGITPEHYEPAFVFSVLIFLFATGFPGISTEKDQNNDPISEVLEGRQLIAGAAMLFERFNELGVDAKLSGWLCRPDTEESLENNEQNRYLTF